MKWEGKKSAKRECGIIVRENLCHKNYENVQKVYWLIIIPLLKGKKHGNFQPKQCGPGMAF